MNKNEILRQLPKMDRILQEPEAEELCRLYGKNRILGILREELDSLRKELLEGKATEAAVFEGLRCSLEAQKGSFRVVIAFTNRFIEVLQEPT